MRTAVRTGFVALLAAALAVTGCGRKEEPAAAGAAATTTVTADEAAAATYVTENTTAGTMQLRDGHYEDGDLVVTDLDLTAQGDLDGDGVDDRAVTLITSTGGSGVFEELYVLRRVNGQVLVSTPGLLGDRVEVNDLRIENGEVVVALVVQGDNDPLCCPTQHVTYRFRLTGNALVETTGQQRVYLRE